MYTCKQIIILYILNSCLILIGLFTNILIYLSLACLIIEPKPKLQINSFVKSMDINNNFFSQTQTNINNFLNL